MTATISTATETVAITSTGAVLTREVRFEPGHDCIRFECCHTNPNCYPGSGGSHGVHGLNIRFLVVGPKGAVQFLVYSGWLPEPEPHSFEKIHPPMAADLGYHSPTPRYEDQSSYSCDLLPDGKCYYDGSGLNAEEPFRILCNEGDEALWAYLERYYATTFEGAAWPAEGSPYKFARRTPQREELG